MTGRTEMASGCFKCSADAEHTVHTQDCQRLVTLLYLNKLRINGATRQTMIIFLTTDSCYVAYRGQDTTRFNPVSIDDRNLLSLCWVTSCKYANVVPSKAGEVMWWL